MTAFVTCASQIPILENDLTFFLANPHRRYRARDFLPEELRLPADVALFSEDERGEIREINLVIVERMNGGRVRQFFAAFADAPSDTDKDIEAFLRARGVAPFQHHWKAMRL